MKAGKEKAKAKEKGKVRCCFYVRPETQEALEDVRRGRIRRGVARSEANTSRLVEEAVAVFATKERFKERRGL